MRILTDEELAEWTRRGRERQGLPARITDPVVLQRIVTLMGPAPSPSSPARSDRDQMASASPAEKQ
jgi:hypothetical protein